MFAVFNCDLMPKEGRYPHQIGLRVDSETLAWCRKAGGALGETPGARLLLALGVKALAAEQATKAPLSVRMEALVAELRQIERDQLETDQDRR